MALTADIPSHSSPQDRVIDMDLALLRALGVTLPKNFAILDYGCGGGEYVRACRARGYAAFGCDILLEHSSEALKLMDSSFRVPWNSESFDFIVSHSVLEHVENHAIAFAEMHRLLRPGGVCLHSFPSRYRPVEPHVFVPLGTLFRGRAWLYCWAALGVRNQMQKGLTSGQVAIANREYLRRFTHYEPGWKLVKIARSCFDEALFVERLVLQNSYGRARQLHALDRFFPFVSLLYGTFWNRAFFMRKQGVPTAETKQPLRKAISGT